MEEPVIGSWWRCTQAPGYIFQYCGRTPEGAFRFTRHSEQKPDVVAAEIEIFNLNSMEPLDP
jgi:hypothetical protein